MTTNQVSIARLTDEEKGWIEEALQDARNDVEHRICDSRGYTHDGPAAEELSELVGDEISNQF